MSTPSTSTINPDRLRDQIGNADLTRVSTAAFSVMNSIQNQRDEEEGGILPGECVAAITAAFVLTLESSRLPASDVISITRNMMADADGRRPEFKAITDYIKKEVLNRA